MGGQVVVAAVLLTVGCNQLTGIKDLRVARCGADAGAGACESGLGSLGERGGGSGGAGDPAGVGGSNAGGNRGGAGGSVDGSGVDGSGAGGGGPRGSAGAAGIGGPGSTVPVVSASSVGAACASDADCSPGLGCTTAQALSGPFLGGGAQGGYCSRPCSGDADCRTSDPGAICVSHAGGPAFCFPECDLLLPSFPDQCNGRSELTCLPTTAGDTAYCVPACQTDSDCAPRLCNLASGYCSDSVQEGEPIGAACASNADCAAGLCLTLPGQTAACTGLCTFGSVAGCGFGVDDSPRLAACTNSIGGELGMLLGLGGTGLCQELCDEDVDCAQADDGWGCTPWPAQGDNAERFGTVGFCELQTDGGGGGGGLCSNTCPFANDGGCDDGGSGSFLPLCDLGTDCADCGSR